MYGASGSIGTATVQMAKHLGAHVTAVCNTKSVELVRSLGPDAHANLHRRCLPEQKYESRHDEP